jgi:glycine betaine/proline transport system ATP-binding protein
VVKRLPAFSLEVDWHGGDEVVALFGPSGAGKTLTLQCLAGLVRPDHGRIVVGGEVFFDSDAGIDVPTQRRRLGYVFQGYALFPHLSVEDNVGYGLRGRPREERRRRAGEVLEIVGLGAWADHYPQQLSGGMQQRVGLGRALALDPEVLFFDEPFSALDPLIRKEMQDELCRLQNEMQRCIVFITHDFAEALRLGDRIAVMKDGSIDQVGTPEAIVAHPATDYVREFTNDVPKEKVLTAHSVLRAVGAEPPSRRVPASTTIGSLIAPLLDTEAPIGIEDADGSLIGEVDRALVARLLDSEPA